MKKIYLISVMILTAAMALLSPSPRAQYIESVEEIIAGNLFGIGARQMAMGGAGIMTNDGTALFYNPANLARVPRIELQFGLSHQRYRDESDVRRVRKIVDFNQVVPSVNILSGRFEGFAAAGSAAEDSKNDTRINSALISIPYPTYRGSMVIGVGVTRLADFDRVFSLYHRDIEIEGDIVASAKEFQSGGIYQWGFGGGIDLSPQISFGATILLYSGKHEYNWEYNLDSLDALTYRKNQFIEDKYLGLGAKVGLSMQANDYLGIGLAMELPAILNVEENANLSYTLIDTEYVSEEFFDYVEYDVKRPFVFSAGLVSRFSNATLMADFDYTDWSQMKYGDNVDMEMENGNIKQYYREVLRVRVGGEYVFPILGLSLRGGLFSDPLPFKEPFQNRSRRGYSLGLGFLVDQVMTIDLAYLHGSYSRNSDFLYSQVYQQEDRFHYLIVDEDISYNRLFLTAAYRF